MKANLVSFVAGGSTSIVVVTRLALSSLPLTWSEMEAMTIDKQV
jgi:hypothetical protein